MSTGICHFCHENPQGVVELCDKHAELERQRDDLIVFVKSIQEGPKERRRYALLQAAAVIHGPGAATHADWQVIDSVNEAQELLTEIEKRENAEGQS